MVPIKQTFVLVSFSLNVSDWNDFTLDFLPLLFLLSAASDEEEDEEEAKGVTQRELISTLRMLFLRARVSRSDEFLKRKNREKV